ncbi:hypothetical protein [Amycolatopsis samaneae]
MTAAGADVLSVKPPSATALTAMPIDSSRCIGRVPSRVPRTGAPAASASV